MYIKLFIYILSIFVSTFVVSGLNINGIFKKNHKVEAKVGVVILIISISYLISNFIIQFYEVCKLV